MSFRPLWPFGAGCVRLVHGASRAQLKNIEDCVQKSVSKHLNLPEGASWKGISLSNLSTKFKIVNDCCEELKVRIGNRELSNATDTASLVKCLQQTAYPPLRPLVNEFDGIDTVEVLLTRNESKLPPNLYFRKPKSSVAVSAEPKEGLQQAAANQ
ncbi:hypothetical protein HDU96_000271 [Phlyctochytrium bullatum]|nr:hypothetical protein HDU96_000271 [Phlyctochytrium bullatum]